MNLKFLRFFLLLFPIVLTTSCDDKPIRAFKVDKNKLELLLLESNYNLDSIHFKTNIPKKLIAQLYIGQAQFLEKGQEEFDEIIEDLSSDGFKDLDDKDYEVFDHTTYAINPNYDINKDMEMLYLQELALNDSIQSQIYSKSIYFFEDKTEYIIQEEFGFWSDFGHMWDALLVKIGISDQEDFDSNWNDIFSKAYETKMLHNDLNLLANNYLSFTNEVHLLIEPASKSEFNNINPLDINLKKLNDQKSILGFIDQKLNNELKDQFLEFLLGIFLAILFSLTIGRLAKAVKRNIDESAKQRGKAISGILGHFGKKDDSLIGIFANAWNTASASQQKAEADYRFNTTINILKFVILGGFFIWSIFYFGGKNAVIENNIALQLEKAYTDYLKSNDFEVRTELDNKTIEFYKTVAKNEK